MIQNMPLPEEFLERSADLYFEALFILVKLCPDDRDLESFFSPECGFDDEEFCKIESIKVGNVALLIFSSIENYLKYKIAQHSPLLLIANLAEIKWKAMDFEEFYMHGFPDLLKIYAVIYESTEDTSLKDSFEHLRIMRNKFVHNGRSKEISLEKLFKVGAFFIDKIWNKNISDHGTIFQFFSSKIGALDSYHDLTNFVAEGEEENDQHKTLLEMYRLNSFYLTTNETLSFIGLNKSEDKEECPVCSIYDWQLRLKNYRFAKFTYDGPDKYIFCNLCQSEVLANKQ